MKCQCTSALSWPATESSPVRFTAKFRTTVTILKLKIQYRKGREDDGTELHMNFRFFLAWMMRICPLK